MSDIQHHIRIQAAPKAVFQALSTIDGFTGWWTPTSGDCNPGGQVDFRFGEHVTSAQVETIVPGQRAEMKFTSTVPDWTGTRMTFDLEPNGGTTLVKFGHRGWKDQNGFFGHCSMQWAVYLLSLKDYVETGKGSPYPQRLEM